MRTAFRPRPIAIKKAYPKICLFLFYLEFILSGKTCPASRGDPKSLCTGAGKTGDTQCPYRSREGQRGRRLAGLGTGGAGARECVAAGDFPAFLYAPPLPRGLAVECAVPIRPKGRQKGESGRFRRGTPARLRGCAQSSSSSFIHRAEQASLGMRQSPRGESETLPTLGPSGKQLRLNCWEKKRR